MDHEFTFDLHSFVRIKDYARHGIITERRFTENQGEIYGVMEPNLNLFYWHGRDLKVLTEEEMVRDVSDEARRRESDQ